MATHRTDVSVRFGAHGPPGTTVRSAESLLVRVPDVRLRSEVSAIALITRSGLVPGLRSPRPRPVSGVSEVVIRTFPRGSTMVRRGTCVDYELLPGEPCPATPGSDGDRGIVGQRLRSGGRPAKGRE